MRARFGVVGSTKYYKIEFIYLVFGSTLGQGSEQRLEGLNPAKVRKFVRRLSCTVWLHHSVQKVPTQCARGN